MRLIAFAGPARSGKTTVADLVAEHAIEAGYQVIREAFAGPLKRAAERVGAGKGDDPDRYRSLCQRWGAEKREKEPGFWVRRMKSRLSRTNQEEKQDYGNISLPQSYSFWKETLVIVDDVRYQNEVELVQELGGVVVFIDPGRRLDLTEEFRQHESEQMANDFLNGKLSPRLFDDLLVNGRDDLEALKEMMAVSSYFWFDELYHALEED